MNRLASVLDVEDVKVDVFAENKLGLFAQAARVFERHRWTGALSMVADTLIERERLASTGLGHGVAIPHGRLKGLKCSVAAVIRVKEPLIFGGPDEEPVTLSSSCSFRSWRRKATSRSLPRSQKCCRTRH